jgi:hypothetical protein
MVLLSRRDGRSIPSKTGSWNRPDTYAAICFG